MGITSNFFHSHLFLVDIDNPKNYGKECLITPSLIFNGYQGRHYYKNIGSAEIIANAIEEDETTKIVGISVGVRGSNNCFLKIVYDAGTIEEDLERIVLCETIDSSNGRDFPVCLINSDVLPSFSTETTIFGQFVSYTTEIKLASSPNELFIDCFDPKKKAMRNSEGHFFRDSEDNVICMTWGKIKRKGILRIPYMLTNIKGKKVQHPGLPFFEMETILGDMTFYMAPAQIFMDKILYAKLLEDECYVMCSFVISIDVAVGEYQEGAIFDESHILRLLGDSLEKGTFERLENTLKDDVIVAGKETTWNKRDSLLRFRSVFYEQIKQNAKITTELIKVKKVLLKNSSLTEGKLGLKLVRISDKKVMGYAFLELSGDHLISSISFCYEDNIFEEEIIKRSNILSFGLSPGKLSTIKTKTELELRQLLDNIIRGKTSDYSILFASLANDAIFNDDGTSYIGKANAYYYFDYVIKKMREKKIEIFTTTHNTAVIYKDYCYVFTIYMNTRGKIGIIKLSVIEKSTFLKKEQLNPVQLTPCLKE